MSDARPSILIVDDEIDNCRNLADILTDLGYHVDIAPDGATALELLGDHRYDVALLDLMMPGMDGAELYGEVKRLRAETVALIVTAYPNNPRAETALAEGAWKIVAKPVEMAGLLGLVDEAAGQPLVLVVDDDDDLCHNLWDVLHDRDYRVCLAHDVKTAMERLREDDFKVILLDLRLPDGDGVLVFREARNANPQARVVVITGCQSEMKEGIDALLTEGARAVFSKPFDVPGLLAALEELVGENGREVQA